MSFANSILAQFAKLHAVRLRKQFMRALHRAACVQERVLLTKLRLHQDSDFGVKHGFGDIRNYSDLVARVPIQSYEDLRPYVDRVAKGDSRALLGSRQRLLMLAMTSGSVDKPKYVPVTEEFLRDYRRGWNIFGVAALSDHSSAWVRGILQVSSAMDEHHTEGGVPCGSISGLMAATQKRLVRKFYVCPSIVSHIPDAEARYYTIMRLSIPCDVAWMITASPAIQVCLARSGVEHAESIVRDIHDGTLSPPAELPGAVGQMLRGRLRPDPVTAGRLEALAQQHGELLPKHYWRLSFLSNWTGGSMRLHLQDFPRYFGDAPIRDLGLLATEGRVSIPFEDGTAAGVLDVLSHFFEFVDVTDGDKSTARPLRCHELTLGRTYRVIMSTSAGFFRYDLGDYVLVHGYMGEAPVVEFLHRGAYVSSITGEKLTEWQVMTAFERACRRLGVAACQFILAPVWEDVPFYRLYAEDAFVSAEKLASLFDEELCGLNVEYASKRSSQRLGGVAMRTLPEGTISSFDKKRATSNRIANEQFKHRYLLSNPGDDAGLLGLPQEARTG